MCRTLLASLLAAALLLVPLPLAGDESTDRLDDAKASLVQLAAWFESLPPDERAVAARELRRWLAETYGSEVPFPFALPSEEEIASWEVAGSVGELTRSTAVEPMQAGETPPLPASVGEDDSAVEPGSTVNTSPTVSLV